MAPKKEPAAVKTPGDPDPFGPGPRDVMPFVDENGQNPANDPDLTAEERMAALAEQHKAMNAE